MEVSTRQLPGVRGRKSLISGLTLLLLVIVLALASSAPPAQAGAFCTNFVARPGALACDGPFFANWNNVIAQRGAFLACAAARETFGGQWGSWWCTTTGNFVTHPYPELHSINGWIRSVELPAGRTNTISGETN